LTEFITNVFLVYGLPEDDLWGPKHAEEHHKITNSYLWLHVQLVWLHTVSTVLSLFTIYSTHYIRPAMGPTE